jgi:Icc-related predicted phosphoesterase
MKFKITLISDTHGKHTQLTKDLPGGDILIHAGDFMNSGYYKTEAIEFFNWFDAINKYDTKIFIAGNHDRLMEDDPSWAQGYLTGYKTIEYLQDEEIGIYHDDLNGEHSEDNIHIYGSPWQPEFHNWAFNLPRNSDIMKEKWDAIPNNTDILVTHGPAFGFLDLPGFGTPMNVGCEMLRYRIDELRPKIHVFGHIHGSYGYYYNGHTHFFNASVLNERYAYANLPFNFEWDNITNEITWL